MKVLSLHPKTVVTIVSPTAVEKFYKHLNHWQQEATNLHFMSEIQKRGYAPKSSIPILITSKDSPEVVIGGQTYLCSNVMERLQGLIADEILEKVDPSAWSASLASVIFDLHINTNPHMKLWVDKFGESDTLLAHILDDKAPAVLNMSSDKFTRRAVQEAADCLKSHKSLDAKHRVLSHQDINLSNVILSKENVVEGLVDWVTLGPTHPSLSIYQLATYPAVWEPFRKQYLVLGVLLRKIFYTLLLLSILRGRLLCGLQYHEECPSQKATMKQEQG